MVKLSTLTLQILLVLSGLSLQAQSFDEIRQKTYHAYAKGEQGLWEEAIDIIEQQYHEKKDSASLYEFMLVQYGYSSYCVEKKLKDKGLSLINQGHGNVDHFLEMYPNDPGALAIKASLLVFEATLKPIKFISLGAESVKITDLAYELDAYNMMALSGKANQLRFSPSMFGGSIDDSILLYNKIISLYDEGLYTAQYDWRYINTMVILAGTYEKKQMYVEACGLYERIISIDSTISWITNKLYPECRKKAGIND